MKRYRLPTLVHAARDLARLVLEPLPSRWRHTVGVANRAQELIPAIGGDDAGVLLAAAWLHDIGYAPGVVDTGFHPLDGARYLGRSGWPVRVVALVAHHSGAIYVAQVLGLSSALSDYPHEVSPLADALTYADQTTDPTGRRIGVEDRVAEALGRHGTHSPQAAARHLRGPHLRAVAARVERRLADAVPPASL